MRLIKQCCRLIHIGIILLKYPLDKPASLRLALEELGPIFVKSGQLLSTRRDLLSPELADELAKLQDKVAPFPASIAKSMIEKRFQKPIETIFKYFDMTPLASASISQVHAAILPDDSSVVVKVLRPHIHQHILRDVGLLETLAFIINRFMPSARRFRPIEVIKEIKATLLDELDLLKEAANASQLKRNFTHSNSLYVPQVYWEYCHKDILVTERIYGVPIADIQALKAHNTDLKRLAEQGVEIFFTQVFSHSFFHADMHPGNIFVNIDDPQYPQYIAVDFGIMGILSTQDQRYLGENFLAFFNRDYRRVAELHILSGWVPPHTRIEAFESAIRTVCEPIFERPLKDLSFAQTLLRLFQTAQRFDMPVQPQLILLQKTLLSIEGLGRQLYPDLDLWNTAKPFLEKWMKTHYGPRAFFKKMKEKFPLWTDKLPELPEAIYDVVQFWQQQTHRMHFEKAPQQQQHLAQKKSHALSYKIFGATLLICGTFVAIANTFSGLNYSSLGWITGIVMITGTLCIFKS